MMVMRLIHTKEELERLEKTDSVVYCVTAFSRDSELGGYDKRIVGEFGSREERDRFYSDSLPLYGGFERLGYEEYLKEA